MTNPFKQSSWNEPTKWLMDLLKSGITYIIVTVFTLLIFTNYIDRKQYKWQSQYGVKIEAFKAYERNSSLYINFGYDAFRSACNGHAANSDSERKDENIRKWEDQGFDDFIISKRSLRRWFVLSDQDRKLKYLLDTAITNKTDSFYLLFVSLKNEINMGDTIKTKTDSTLTFWHDYEKHIYKPFIERFYSVNEDVIQLCQSNLSRID